MHADCRWTSKVKAVLPNFQKDNKILQIVTSFHPITKGHRIRELFCDQYLSMKQTKGFWGVGLFSIISLPGCLALSRSSVNVWGDQCVRFLKTCRQWAFFWKHIAFIVSFNSLVCYITYCFYTFLKACWSHLSIKIDKLLKKKSYIMHCLHPSLYLAKHWAHDLALNKQLLLTQDKMNPTLAGIRILTTKIKLSVHFFFDSQIFTS